VDGGASKVTACLLDEEKTVLAEFTVHAGANYHALSLVEVVDHVAEAVQGVVGRSGLPTPVVVDQTVLGLAGCNFADDCQTVQQALRQSALVSLVGSEILVVNDSVLGLRSGTDDGVGVVLVAGTGSNCYGRNAAGEEARAGGMDFILSDEGSGYDIGMRLLKAVTRSLDGRLGETVLVEKVFGHLKVDSLESLHREVYARYSVKPAIASLAPLVAEAAENGDLIAQDIMAHSVNELIRMVDAVIKKLSLQEKAAKVVVTGSVFSEHHYFERRFRDELKRAVTHAEIVKPEVSSAVAAAWIALEM
jgi:N-acetylglucosamine kinase-like BadF-type ATPase